MQAQLAAWAPWAERLGLTLVAPLFGRKAFRGYQRLEASASVSPAGACDRFGRGHACCSGPSRFGGGDAGGIPADRALLDLLEQLRRDGRIGWGPVFLFGYSGGAQFVHRFLLAHPGAADGAIVAAAGFYTFPDRMTPYPYGLASRGGARTFGVDEFLRKPLLVAVGNEDVQRDRQLRRREWVDAWQGPNRVERAVRWTEALQREARRRGIEVSIALHRLPGAGHSFSQCMRAGLNWQAGMFLADQLARWAHPGG